MVHKTSNHDFDYKYEHDFDFVLPLHAKAGHLARNTTELSKTLKLPRKTQLGRSVYEEFFLKRVYIPGDKTFWDSGIEMYDRLDLSGRDLQTFDRFELEGILIAFLSETRARKVAIRIKKAVTVEKANRHRMWVENISAWAESMHSLGDTDSLLLKSKIPTSPEMEWQLQMEPSMEWSERTTTGKPKWKLSTRGKFFFDERTRILEATGEDIAGRGSYSFFHGYR